MFLVEGKTCSGIAEYLNSLGIKTPASKDRWTKNTVNSILKNEKYKGDAILQKTYIKDFLEHKSVANKGELPKYVVENSHPAIIDRDMWEMVQTELKRRVEIEASYSSVNEFSSKLVCGDCGGFYGKKVWHSTDRCRKEIFQCNKKFAKGKEKCLTPILAEEDIKAKFIKAYNDLMVDKKQVVEDINLIIDALTDTSKIDSRIIEYENEMAIVSELVKKMVRENTNQIQDQDEYNRKYNELQTRFNKAKESYEECIKEKAYKNGKAITLRANISSLESAEQVIQEWNYSIWMTVLDKAIVNRDGTITFKFISDKEITI